MIKTKLQSGHYLLFRMAPSQRRKQATIHLTAKQRRMIKSLGTSSNVSYHSSKRGRTTLILAYDTFCYGLMKVVLACLANYSIVADISAYSAVKCIKAFIHEGCTPLLELYGGHLQEVDLTVQTLAICLHEIV